jgi:hypothetical protein
MLLSAELFSEILSKLTSDPKPERGNERRNSPRVGVRAKIEVMRHITGEHSMVWMREMSRTGIGFLHAKKFVPGEMVHVHFPGADGGHVVGEYEVKHCTPTNGGPCIVGAMLKQMSRVAAQPRKVG